MPINNLGHTLENASSTMLARPATFPPRRCRAAARLFDYDLDGSIIAPLLALVFMVGLFALLATVFSKDPVLALWLWGLWGLCIFATLAAYGVWCIREPDRLQTEDYRLARHRIDVIGDERNPNDVPTIEAVPNPHKEASDVEASRC